MELNIRLSDRNVLRGFIKSPGDHLKAGIILVHGIGDHTARYNHWINRFFDRGIASAGVDLPGHGKSDGKRGHIKNYSATSEMLDILINEYRKTFPGIPVFLYGHSLGGEIVLKYLIDRKPTVKGAIISSPYLRLAFKPPEFKVFIANILNFLLPSLVLPTGLNVSYISHDRQVVDNYTADPLVHDKISLSLFHTATAAAEYILNHAQEIDIPLYIFHGSDDLITSPDGSRELASKTGKSELRIWQGGYHELHNEPVKDEVFSEIITWIEKHI
jgi:alpha-beta hydrolase superfamily lysophospholipase